MVCHPGGPGPQTSTAAEVHAGKDWPASLFCKDSIDTEYFRGIAGGAATRLVKLSPGISLPGRGSLQLNMKFLLLIIHLCCDLKSKIVRDRNECEQKHAD